MSSHPRRSGADNFLYSEKEKSDYDWLVTPPGSPKSLMNQPDANPMLRNCLEDERDNVSSKNQTTAPRSTSRPSTPTRRSAIPATMSTIPTSRVNSTAARANLTTTSSKSASIPSTPTKRPSSSGTSRATLTSSTFSSKSTSKPSTPTRRPSTSGTSRATLTSSTSSSRSKSIPSPSKTAASSGTSRPTFNNNARATTGSATSTRRPMSAPNTKPGSRSSTLTPAGSSTVLKSKATKPVSIPAPSHPILRSRAWEPYEMPGFSLEAPSNLRTTLPDRPQTASSRRTGAFGASSSSRSASIERENERRQSCSPSRNRAKTINDDDSLISPVAMGNQMVERVTNMRKLAPLQRIERGSGSGSTNGKSNTGFGRNLSKSSIDMALRHMDIKGRNMKGNIGPLMRKVPAASLYSVGSSGKRSEYSSRSSESSVNILCIDNSDDNLSDIS